MPPPIQPGASLDTDQAAFAEARRVMPDFLQEQPAAPQQPAPQAPSEPLVDPIDYSPFSDGPAESMDLKNFQVHQATAALEYLMREEAAARDRGDYIAAQQARDMADRLTTGVDVERIPKQKGRHPALQKLLGNLGLEKIKPAEIEWAGTRWMFAATIMISASLVGLDGVPLYEVLNIPLDAEYVISAPGAGENKPKRVTQVALYRRHCDCGVELEVDLDSCPHCKAAHDKFDMPPDLRMKCAEFFYQLLEQKFGAYEELAYLLDIKTQTMKDRQMDKEELYPLARPSQEQKKTTTSPSGDE
jgi:hypothetical protein